MTRNTMSLTIAATALSVGCATMPVEDTPIDGSVEILWQVGASGCELSGVDTVVVVRFDDMPARVEGVVFALRSVVVQASAVAVFVFFFGDRATLVTVLGANAFRTGPWVVPHVQ